MTETTAQSVAIFDGYCNLCNIWANFLLAVDSKRKLKFATRQSEAGKRLVMRFDENPESLDSIIFAVNGMLYSRSTAVLHILRLLGGFWQLLYVFIIIPRPIRDFVYDVVARNRYHWFGKRIQCRVPSAQDRERFLD